MMMTPILVSYRSVIAPMSMAIRPRANIKPPKAFLLLLFIFLSPLAFPGFTSMVNSLGAGGTYYLLWGFVGELRIIVLDYCILHGPRIGKTEVFRRRCIIFLSFLVF